MEEKGEQELWLKKLKKKISKLKSWPKTKSSIDSIILKLSEQNQVIEFYVFI